jgi:hypothetical protein
MQIKKVHQDHTCMAGQGKQLRMVAALSLFTTEPTQTKARIDFNIKRT